MVDVREQTGPEIAAALDPLPRTDAARIGTLALLRRVETKFLLPVGRLATFVRSLGGEYGLPPDGTGPLAAYRNLYFDSPKQTFYLQHHRGRRPRHKVRIRHYLGWEQSRLEIKHKNNHDLILKLQGERPFGDETLGPADWDFLDGRIACRPADLAPQLEVSFSRAALFGLRVPERLTIDLDLAFGRGDQGHRLPGLAIVEVKQAHFSPRSPAMLGLRDLGFRPASFSKYCAGQAILHPGLRQNRFRESLRALWRLSHA